MTFTPKCKMARAGARACDVGCCYVTSDEIWVAEFECTSSRATCHVVLIKRPVAGQQRDLFLGIRPGRT